MTPQDSSAAAKAALAARREQLQQAQARLRDTERTLERAKLCRNDARRCSDAATSTHVLLQVQDWPGGIGIGLHNDRLLLPGELIADIRAALLAHAARLRAEADALEAQVIAEPVVATP